jgi:hypothetical protein
LPRQACSLLPPQRSSHVVTLEQRRDLAQVAEHADAEFLQLLQVGFVFRDRSQVAGDASRLPLQVVDSQLARQLVDSLQVGRSPARDLVEVLDRDVVRQLSNASAVSIAFRLIVSLPFVWMPSPCSGNGV